MAVSFFAALGLSFVLQTFLGTGRGFGSTVTLSSEVRSYIDKAADHAGGASAEELQRLTTRLSELEARLVDLDKFRDLREQMETQRQELEKQVNEFQLSHDQALSQSRDRELASLKNEMARLCSGVGKARQ